MQKAFLKVKDDLEDQYIMKEAFYYVRDNIHEVVSSCAENIRVVIYFNDVIDDPLVVATGSEENRLRISINTDGKVTYAWTKQTWTKVFRDAKEGVKSITQKIITGFLSLFTKKSLSIENKKLLPIKASK